VGAELGEDGLQVPFAEDQDAVGDATRRRCQRKTVAGVIRR
jgi:hypothetical protein